MKTPLQELLKLESDLTQMFDSDYRIAMAILEHIRTNKKQLLENEKKMQDKIFSLLDVSGKKMAVAFAQWISVYASQVGTGWVIMKEVEPMFCTSEQLFEEFMKVTDR